MTRENKQLLFQEICARLPHHVRCKVWLKDGTTEEGPLDLQHNYGDVLRDAFYYNKIIDIKPYLRPMSSMTEEEKKEMRSYIHEQAMINIFSKSYYIIRENDKKYWNAKSIAYFDWLNKNMFDYRGLIEKGLALDCTNLNIY